MRFIFRQWDGTEFRTQDHLQSFTNFMEYLFEYGEDAIRALRELAEDLEQRKIIDQWIEEGLLEKIGVRFRLTPRAINSMQRKALMEVFRGMKANSSEGHESTWIGPGGERTEGTRRYQFGDPLSDVDQSATLRNAIIHGGLGVPIRLEEADFKVHLTESKATCSTVILLDMSGSMSRWNRFAQAKKCAMAMYALIRQRYPSDTVDIVGFASGAEPIPEHRLPLVLPKRISMIDPQVRMRVPVSQLDQAPQHFTNLQMGLKTARRILGHRGGHNKQVFIITDGQPTAHVQGEYIYLVYPPDEETAMATLSEAIPFARQGIRFSTFALIEDYFFMDWINFVDHLTKLTKGVAFYCTSGDLTNCVMESYLSGRKTKAYLA
ncbi:MAG: VWA domain-containing protein [Phycisphaerales bacterium]|nr:MAG: VWA domain-containing protein [Phycisphaerales bacterium]